MSATLHPRPPLVVGVDAGGTWIRLRARRAGRVVARRTVRASVMPDVGSVLRSEWRRRGWTRGEVAALVVAARGAWTPTERRTLARSLAPLARRVAVMSDVEGAWHGAFGGGPGVLVLAGTGSIVLGRDAGGRWAREGGLGPLVGDEGSAFWLAREWLRLTPEAAAVARRLGRAPGPVARIAGRAPRVLAAARRRQPTAARVVREGQRRLAEQVAAVVRRLALPRPVTVSWAGGLIADPWFREGLRRALGRQGISARWRPPAADPVEGATEAAARLAAAARSPARRRGPRP
jgi:N-acetylglucosamine kinase-like BadF-type ATPase